MYEYFISAMIQEGFDDFWELRVELLLYGRASRKSVMAKIDAPLPPELQCPICRELLNQPVLVDGFVFCEHCIDTWKKRSRLNPVTGVTTCAIKKQSHIHREFAVKFAELYPE
jgi:hypothetical protein